MGACVRACACARGDSLRGGWLRADAGGAVVKRRVWNRTEEGDPGREAEDREGVKNQQVTTLLLGKVFPFNTRLSRIEMQAFYAITSNVKIGNT